MVNYQKIRKNIGNFFLEAAMISLLIFGVSSCLAAGLPEPAEGNYKGHVIKGRNEEIAHVTRIEGRENGILMAEDHKPFGNWDGIEDRIILEGVSEADSLYRFVYPNVLNEAYETLAGIE